MRRRIIIYALTFFAAIVCLLFSATLAHAVMSSDITLVLETERFDDVNESVDRMVKRIHGVVTSDMDVTEVLHETEYGARRLVVRIGGLSAEDFCVSLSEIPGVGATNISDVEDGIERHPLSDEDVYLEVHVVDVDVKPQAVTPIEDKPKESTLTSVLRFVTSTFIAIVLFVILVRVILWGGKKVAYFFAHQEVPVSRPSHSILDEDIEDTREAAKSGWYRNEGGEVVYDRFDDDLGTLPGDADEFDEFEPASRNAIRSGRDDFFADDRGDVSF